MKAVLIILLFGFSCATTPVTASETGASKPAVITGFATFYTVKSCQREGTSGLLTASGKRYDESAMICALPFHPRKVNGRPKWGQLVRVTNTQTDKSILVAHTDYGPGKKATRRGVVIDLTPAAFKALGGKLEDGKMKVKIEKIKEGK